VKLNERSEKNLVGVHPNLEKVVRRAAEIVAMQVIEGVRTQKRQDELYAQGRTKPGNKVTWTRTSNHFVNPKTKFGHAVDCTPLPLDWNDGKAFQKMADAMFQASKELNIPIRWGADWDRDGKPRERGETDSPHFELWGVS
jgi:peptidoglycan LD-endopeptidase CwlK